MLTRAGLRRRIAARIRRRQTRRWLPFFILVFGATLYLAPRSPFPLERPEDASHPTPARALARMLGAPVVYPVPVQYAEFRFNGFGAQFLRVLDAAAVADAAGSPFEVVEGRYWNYGCAPGRGWSCYFDRRPAPFRNCTRIEQLPEIGGEPAPTCIRIASTDATRRASGFMAGVSRGGLEPSRRLAQRLWRLNARTRSAVDDILSQTGLPSLRGEYVGVHVRRGDKRKEVPDVPLAAYAAAVRCVAGDLPVVVATDDGTVLAKLRAMLPERDVLALPGTAARTGHYQVNVNRGYMKRNARSVVALLADVTALKDARWFVSTFSSNLARMVHVLRDAAADTSVSLDDRWAPGVAWHTFGQKYCGSAGANREFCECQKSRAL